MTALTTRDLERARRELAASLALTRPDSLARAPILAHLTAIDIELTRQTGQQPDRLPGSPARLAVGISSKPAASGGEVGKTSAPSVGRDGGMFGGALLCAALRAVLSQALGVTLAGMREQAVQVVVDDSLSLLDRGLAAEDARAQARGHGKEADGFQVRVQVGGRAVGALGRSQLRGDHVDHSV